MTRGSGSLASLPLPVLFLVDPYHSLAWGEDGMCKQMRNSCENHVLEVCEVMDAMGQVTWPFPEHGVETTATTEIREHLRITGEKRPFFTLIKNSIFFGPGNQNSSTFTPA